MRKEEFRKFYNDYKKKIEQIRTAAHALHAHVNQHYDKVHPYGFHLDMVADAVYRYGHLVCVNETDVLPLFFGAYFHDSIEDARQTYNDVLDIARQYMNEEQAHTATEIVYALTNDKGRNRAERAGERYYKGIRETPYAPFVKMADRLANITFSCSEEGPKGGRMREVYKGEMAHFLPSINPHSKDPRLGVPIEMIEALAEILIEEVDRDEMRRQWGEL